MEQLMNNIINIINIVNAFTSNFSNKGTFDYSIESLEKVYYHFNFEIGEKKGRKKMKINKVKMGLLFILILLMLSGCSKQSEQEEESKQVSEVTQKIESNIQQFNKTEKKNVVDVSVYDELLKEIYEAIVSRSEDMLDIEGMTGVHEMIRNLRDNDVLAEIGYKIEDINGDDIPELIIGSILEVRDSKSYGSTLYALYTYKDEKPQCLFDGYLRNRYYWLGDGKFLNNGSSGAIYHIWATYELMTNSLDFQCVDYYFTHEKDENFEDIRIYHNTTGEWNVTVSEELTISEDEFKEIVENLDAQIKMIELTPFIKYENARPQDMIDFWTEKVIEDDFCAVAYLGNQESEYSEFIEYLKEKGLIQKYPFLNKIDEEHIVLAEGSEWYVVFPTEKETTLVINEAVLDESDYILQSGKELLTVNDDQPVLLRGNISEIMSNLLITIQKSDGQNMVYSPRLSMMDGTLQRENGVFDFTPYEMLEFFAFEIIKNPEEAEYIFYMDKTDMVVTSTVVDSEDVVPMLFLPLKDEMKVKVEMLEWDNSGEPYVTDIVEERIVSVGQPFYISTMLFEDKPQLRMTVTYTDSEVERIATWYALVNENGEYDTEYVLGY